MQRKMNELPGDMDLSTALARLGLNREKAFEHVIELLTDMGNKVNEEGTQPGRAARAALCFVCALTLAEHLCDMRNEEYPWEKEKN